MTADIVPTGGSRSSRRPAASLRWPAPCHGIHRSDVPRGRQPRPRPGALRLGPVPARRAGRTAGPALAGAGAGAARRRGGAVARRPRPPAPGRGPRRPRRALARGARVGADIEWLRPRPAAMTLARRFFTAREAAALGELPADEAEGWFVRLWCAKEAVLKAHGHGIAFGLEKLEFARDGERWRLQACDPELGAPEDWHLHAFTPAPGYLATLDWRPPSTMAR